MGDFNAKVGKYNTDVNRQWVGVDTANQNGERQNALFLTEGLVKGVIIFPHRNTHKKIWIISK